MSQDAQPHLSLLSLSIAAANAAPISASPESAQPRSSQGLTTNTTKHRRLSSAGRSRRRLSDARDAATRPFPTSLQTASASLAALSLSSPAVSHRSIHTPQPIQVPRKISTKNTSTPEPASVDDSHLSVSPPQSHTPLSSVNGIKSGRKRGTTFTCESCSKVYRHPSCLIKHRWEHTPQWREASKFVLSKHQQVQLLEAAAILSHLSPSSASLPEDRSLWPSFLSGGVIPPPASVLSSEVEPAMTLIADPRITLASTVRSISPVSSSVPASSVLSSGSPGPLFHDYLIDGARVDVPQVHPGILGLPTTPMRVPAQLTATSTDQDDALNLLALRSPSVTSGSWGSSASVSKPFPSSSHPHAHTHSHSLSAPHVWKERERRRSNAYEYGFVSSSAAYLHASHLNSGWSLPRSSIRSKSGSSGSRSRSQSVSESQSDDEDESVLQDMVQPHRDVDSNDGPRVYGSRVRAWRTEDGDDGVIDISVREDGQDVVEDKSMRRSPAQTWEGMEMEMEMD